MKKFSLTMNHASPLSITILLRYKSQQTGRQLKIVRIGFPSLRTIKSITGFANENASPLRQRQVCTQSPFTGQVGLLPRESCLDRVKRAGSYGKKPLITLITLEKGPLDLLKHVNSDWDRVSPVSCPVLSLYVVLFLRQTVLRIWGDSKRRKGA